MKNQCYKFEKNGKELEDFKSFVKKNNCKSLRVDLSDLNIFDAIKYALLSSAYLFQNSPSGKLELVNYSGDIKNLISNFSLTNVEFV